MESVNIIQLSLREYEIGLIRPIKTGSIVHTDRRGAIITASDGSGNLGFGEIAPLDGYSQETVDTAVKSVKQFLAEAGEVLLPDQDGSLISCLTPLLPGITHLPPSAKFGIETAVLDFVARKAELRLCDIISDGAADSVSVNALIEGSTVKSITAAAQQACDFGFACIKLKVGRDEIDGDIRCIHAVREAVGPDILLRIDANRTLSFKAAERLLDDVRHVGIDYIEEPLNTSELHRIPDLFDKTGVNIAVDESIQDPSRWRRMIQTEAIVAAVIKPSLVGGISTVLELIDVAKSAGKRVVLSSMFESGIGFAACLHIAASLGSDCSPCGLDTLSRMNETLVDHEFAIIDGRINLPDRYGLGVNLVKDNPGHTEK
jgi:o-succinylbenzoate synthase